MRRDFCLMLLSAALALTGCGRGPESAEPDWTDARRNLPIGPEDCRKAPNPDERGAQGSDALTEGDLVSLVRKGWRYTWQLESVDGTNIVLKQVDATKMR